MKVKIITRLSTEFQEFEELINNFIKDTKVFDIKFTSDMWKMMLPNGKIEDDVILHAFIMYEEKLE